MPAELPCGEPTNPFSILDDTASGANPSLTPQRNCLDSTIGRLACSLPSPDSPRLGVRPQCRCICLPRPSQWSPDRPFPSNSPGEEEWRPNLSTEPCPVLFWTVMSKGCQERIERCTLSSFGDTATLEASPMPEFPILLTIRTEREFRLVCERIRQLEGKPPSPIRTIELRRLRAAALRFLPPASEPHPTPHGVRDSEAMSEG